MEKVFPVKLDISKGLYTNMPLTQIPPGGCSAVSHLVLQHNFLVPRPSFNTVNGLGTINSGHTVMHLNMFTMLTGTQYMMAITMKNSDSTIHVYYFNGTTWADITGSLSATFTDRFDICTSCNFKGKWYFTTGGRTNLYSWDGVAVAVAEVTNATPALSPPTAPMIVMASGARLFLLNAKTSGTRIPYRVYWSDFLLPTVWNGGVGGGSSSYQDLLDDNEPIVAGYITPDSIYIFKPTSIYSSPASTGYPTYFEFTRFKTKQGCVAPLTIKSYNDKLIFLGHDNVYMADKQNILPIGDTIIPDIQPYIVYGNIENCISSLDPINKLYHLFVPYDYITGTIVGGPFPILIIEKLFCNAYHLNLENGAWTRTGIGSTSVSDNNGIDYTKINLNCSYDMPYSSQSINRNYFGDTTGRVVSMDFNIALAQDLENGFTPFWTSGILDAFEISQGQYNKLILRDIIIETEEDYDYLNVEPNATSLNIVGEFSCHVAWGDYLYGMGTKHLGTKKMYKGEPSKGIFITNKQGKYFKIKLTMPHPFNGGRISKIVLNFVTTENRIS